MEATERMNFKEVIILIARFFYTKEGAGPKSFKVSRARACVRACVCVCVCVCVCSCVCVCNYYDPRVVLFSN